MPSGRCSNHCFVRNAGTIGEAGRGKIRERCCTVSFGFCAPALLGTICPVVILPIRLVIAASSSGSAAGCSHNCSRNWRRTCATEASSI